MLSVSRASRSSCTPTRRTCVRDSTGYRASSAKSSAADPLDGSLFLFVNRRRDRLKILHFDGTGFWVYYKRLEAGTFEPIASDGPYVEIDATQLAMLLGGVSLASASVGSVIAALVIVMFTRRTSSDSSAIWPCQTRCTCYD